MNQLSASCLWERVRKTLAEHLTIWLLPTVAIGTLGTIYALVRPPTWEAVQELIIREEAVGELDPDGRFNSTDARKAAQEMVTQIARNRNVVAGAMRQVAADSARSNRTREPRDKEIKELQEKIRVAASKGAELGQSDLIYLAVRARSAKEAIRLNTAVCDQLEQRLQQLRNRRARSMTQELAEKLKLTQQNLNEATQRLETMEQKVGHDLGELRTLNQSGAGDSNLRVALNQIKNDLRTARSDRTAQEQQLQILLAASRDPETLVATPNRMLESHPGLRRLKEGLIDAQLQVAELIGKMNEAHPDVKAARTAEAEIQQNLYRELETSIRGLQADLQVTDALIASYETQLSTVQQRLDQLATLRARYGNLVEEVSHRSDELRQAQRALAEARAEQEAAQASSLVTRVDGPDAGDAPLGPSRLVLLLGSWIGALAIGLGWMLLLTPGEAKPTFGRRWTDQLTRGMMTGRRAADRIGELPSGTAVIGGGRRESDAFHGPDPADLPSAGPANPAEHA